MGTNNREYMNEIYEILEKYEIPDEIFGSLAQDFCELLGKIHSDVDDVDYHIKDLLQKLQ